MKIGFKIENNFYLSQSISVPRVMSPENVPLWHMAKAWPWTETAKLDLKWSKITFNIATVSNVIRGKSKISIGESSKRIIISYGKTLVFTNLNLEWEGSVVTKDFSVVLDVCRSPWSCFRQVGKGKGGILEASLKKVLGRIPKKL